MSRIKEPPDPNDFTKEIKKILDRYHNRDLDKEDMHIELDEYICEVMESLGYKEGIRLFRTTPKWYS